MLFTDTDSLVYETKTEDIYEDFSQDKKMFDFCNYSTKLKFHDNTKKLVVGKMKDETSVVTIKEIVGVKPKMHLFLVDDSSEHKKEIGVNKNVVATVSHGEYKDVLWNNECLRHLMIRIQSKNHKIRIYEINKISLSCFDDKIYI